MIICPLCGESYKVGCTRSPQLYDLDDHLNDYHEAICLRDRFRDANREVDWLALAAFMEQPDFPEWLLENHALALLAQ